MATDARRASKFLSLVLRHEPARIGITLDEAGWTDVDAALPGIRARGLIRGQRHHVHLSADLETAQKVGGRRGRPVVLVIRAGEMAAAGHAFYRSANGVWLVEHVPVQFIDFGHAPADRRA